MEKAALLLGVPLNSSPAVLKRAYYKKALAVHPDKNTDPDAAEKFRELRDAYSVLCEGSREEEKWFDPRTMINMLADNVSEETLLAMYNFLMEYKNFIPEHTLLLSIIESKLSRPHIVVEPTLQNLFEQKVFIYNHDNGKKYSIPLWQHTLFFDDLIVVCRPKTGDSDVWVDDSNNIHTSVYASASSLLLSTEINFEIGSKKFSVPATELRICPLQTHVLRSQGIPLPDNDDILAVNDLSDVVVRVYLSC
jgi:hypothetical protein